MKLILNNDPPFGFTEFVKFYQVNSITLIKSSLYHLQRNGKGSTNDQKTYLTKAFFHNTINLLLKTY